MINPDTGWSDYYTFTLDSSATDLAPDGSNGSGIKYMKVGYIYDSPLGRVADGRYMDWGPYVPSLTINMIDGQPRPREIYVQYMDNLGNVSEEYQESIFRDTTAPGWKVPTDYIFPGTTIAPDLRDHVSIASPESYISPYDYDQHEHHTMYVTSADDV
ncbi:MAG: hypothetical protein HQL28_00890, partial [Candidatus Omnitrophica bacterium]|nr:hypothetical protein [Candidatus Omnitrophota bacterium]